MESLADKLVEYVANRHKLSKPQSVKFIDKCLQKISIQENTSYHLLYDIFFTFAGLSFCLAGSCSKVDLEECGKLCHCVIFKNQCVPRYLPNAVEINEDPDKWIQAIKTTELEKLVEYASYLYYNYDGGGLTDNAFDALEYILNKRLKRVGRRWEKIGAEPIDKIKATLPYPMPSLDKLKPGNPALLAYLAKGKQEGMIWSCKLDGVSAMVIYKAGKVDKIYTRGNGEIGGDVSYLKDYITLPKVSYSYMVVRGELILSKKTWQEKYIGSYANPRSFVSAKVNSGYISPAFPDIDFVAYQLVDWSEKKTPQPSQALKILQAQGFKVADNGSFKKEILIFDVISLYKEKRETSPYTIDGIVLTLDIAQEIKQLSNPEYSKAFKMTLEEQLRNTRITNVDWNITRYGRYFPVAIFEAVYIDGFRLHRASAHNANHVIDWHLGKGTRIVVSRSGDVIPTIKDVTVDEKINAILPPDKYQWHWLGRDILLDEIDENPEVQIRRLIYFFSTIRTPQLGEGRIRRLYEAGMTTIKDITSAKQSDIIKIKGFGQKLSKSIYENIHNTMRTTRMDRYFVAITTFKTQIGRTLLKNVLRYYPDILTASKKEILTFLTKNKIPGIGPARKDALAESMPRFRDVLLDLNKEDIEFALKYQEKRLQKLKETGYNKKIKGKTFVTTGFLNSPDYDFEDYIWDHWGDLASTVTSKTTAVISANVANITGKMLKAHDMGIPVYSMTEFVIAFDVPVKVREQTELIIAEGEND
jgi:DNA ligase (NAD+)